MRVAGAEPAQGVSNGHFRVAEKIDLREWGLNMSQYISMQGVAMEIEMETEQGGGTLRR